MYEELDEKVFARGDSSVAAAAGEDSEMARFLGDLKKAMNVEIKFTVVLDDPLANSYIQNTWAPDPDPGLTEEDYERSHEQNEELGLNDMKTENYGHVDVIEGAEAEQQDGSTKPAPQDDGKPIVQA